MHSRHPRVSEQAGFGLVEVLVTALVVVLVSLAVLGAIDSASRASGTSKAKAIAANLAQEDQERLHQLKPAQIAALGVTAPARPVQVDGVTYTVRSEGQYVVGRGQSSGCTSTHREEHLRIVSEVRWPKMNGVRPVRVESLVAPSLDALAPGLGSAVLKVTRADGVTPVTGLGVAFTGPTAASQTTGAEGCVFFANFPVGAYAFGFGQSGWVDPNGVQNPQISPVGVGEGRVASSETRYDQAGAVVAASFATYLGSGSTPTFIAGTSSPRQLTLSHSEVTVDGGKRSATSASATTTTGTLPPPGTWQRASRDRLFPFTTPYSVYSSGMCGQPLPAATAAFVQANGGTTSLLVEPNRTYSNVAVFEPAMVPTVRYQQGNGNHYNPVAGARFFVKSSNPACAIAGLPTGSPWAQTTDAGGGVPDKAFPYPGASTPYLVCADYLDPSSNRRRSTGWSSRINNDPNGMPLAIDLRIDRSTGPSAPCA